MYLSASALAKIKGFMPDYKFACDTVGFTEPLILVPLHYEESDLGDHGDESPEPEGAFGCDQGGDDELRAFYWEVCDLYGYNRPVNLDYDFRAAALVAAHELKLKLRGVGPREAHLNLDCLADAYWGYNGRSHHHNALEQVGAGSSEPSWHYSPYVCNDPANGVKLRVIATQPGKDGQIIHVDRISERPGAIVIYREIIARRAELA